MRHELRDSEGASDERWWDPGLGKRARRPGGGDAL